MRFHALQTVWHARSERLWVGLIAVPLAEIATALLGMWWSWPLLILVAWSATPSWRWLWLLSLEMGFIGVLWASVGITALGHFASQLWLVGIVWAAFPVALALVGINNRRGMRDDARRDD